MRRLRNGYRIGNNNLDISLLRRGAVLITSSMDLHKNLHDYVRRIEGAVNARRCKGAERANVME